MATQLADEGIAVEVVDVRTISPLDRDGIAVARSGRVVVVVVVVDQGYRSFGVGAEIAESVVETRWAELLAPPVRIDTGDGPIPCNPDLERAFMPGDRVLHACRRLVHGT